MLFNIWAPVKFFLSIEWITSEPGILLFYRCSYYYVLLSLLHHYSLKLGCIFGALFGTWVIQPANMGKVIFHSVKN